MGELWCPNCNLPIIGSRCGRCGSGGVPIGATGPLNLMPLFPDHAALWESIRSFGGRCDETLRDKLVLMNRVNHTDRLEEVIVDGRVVGQLIYVVGRGFQFRPKADFALYMSNCLEKKVVRPDEGAWGAILQGRNLMIPGVQDADAGIRAGDPVIVVGPGGAATGTARVDGGEMVRGGRGLAVKVRDVALEPFSPGRQPSMVEILEANEGALRRLEEVEISRLRRVVRRFGLPVAVSFSGGKDSTASALIAVEAGLDPTLIYLDTGIELPGVREYAVDFARRHGLRILIAEAGGRFWEEAKRLGPPARDRRWCTEALKEEPTRELLKREFPEGVLMIVGQRAQESPRRRRAGRLGRNPRIPGQVSYSPVQEWSTFQVFLYLIWKREPINPWYKFGLARLGCFLCPSQDLGDLEIVRRLHPELVMRWVRWLEDYARSRGYPRGWVELGGWRWVRAPPWLPDEARTPGH